MSHEEKKNNKWIEEDDVAGSEKTRKKKLSVSEYWGSRWGGVNSFFIIFILVYLAKYFQANLPSTSGSTVLLAGGVTPFDSTSAI